MDVDTLRGLFITGLVVVMGLFIYWIWLFFQVQTMHNAVVMQTQMQAPPRRKWVQNTRLLDLINKAHQDCGWHYTWQGPVDPPGEIVLAWREWTEASGHKDRTLDVLLVKKDGSVETLGTCIEYEVFGDPKEY